MKILKFNEDKHIYDDIKEGDYVIIDYTYPTSWNVDYLELLKNVPGEVVHINNLYHQIEVRHFFKNRQEFDNFKKNLRYIYFDDKNKEYYGSNVIPRDSVTDVGKTPEEIELKISTKKYNL